MRFIDLPVRETVGSELSPPNKNPNFDTRRIKVRVLALYPEIAVFAAVLPRVGLNEKPGQVVCLVGFERLWGLCGPRVGPAIVKSVVIVELLGNR